MIIAVIYATYAVAKRKPGKNSDLNGIQTHDLCDTGAFNEASPLYQKALDHDDSGYNHHLTFSPPTAQTSNSARRNHQRDIFCYNLPFSKNVATNVGRSFLKILDEEFPKNHALHKIFNRNIVKISYSCMPNLKQKIDGHNESILRKTNVIPSRACNYRQPTHWPMAGNCLKSSVVYQATVTTENSRPAQPYVGITENSFKTRFANHRSSFSDPNKRLSTELSKHIWRLKNAKPEG